MKKKEVKKYKPKASNVCDYCSAEFKRSYFRLYYGHQRPDFSKLKKVYLNPGDKIKIIWGGEYSKSVDYGYIIELPKMNHKEYDVMVHIYKSVDNGGTIIDSAWVHLFDLLKEKDLIAIEEDV